MMNIEDILDILAVKLLGVVPDDENVVISTNRGEPVIMDEKALSGKAYRNIVRRIIGEEVDFLNLENTNQGKLSKMMKILFGR